MSANTEMLIKVAQGLKHLADDMVFVGGAITELYADDPAATEIRPTKDVDCVVEISTRTAYYDLEEQLRMLGFVNDRSQSSHICRWIYEDTIVDIMPTDEKILGFSNQWYEAGIAHKIIQPLTDQLSIFTFTLPYYLASKFVALNSRGSKDLRTSHDFEDIIYVLDNNLEVMDNLTANDDDDVKAYLSNECKQLLLNPNIDECITAALPYGMEERLEVIRDLMDAISRLSK